MEMPNRSGQPPGPRLPEIYVHDSNPNNGFRMASRSSSYSSAPSPISSSSIAMPIPNAREPAPPPLPPPRHIPDIANGGGNNGPDLAWRWMNSHEDQHDSGRSVSSVQPGSSLYGNFASRKSIMKEERPDHTRRGSSISTIKSADAREHSYPRLDRDEGYASLSSTSIGSDRSKYHESPSAMSGFQSSVHEKYQANAQAYDKSLLQKLDARRTTDNTTPPRGPTRSAFSTSANANDRSPSRMANEHRIPLQLRPLSLPTLAGRPVTTESPLSRWAETSHSSSASPINPYPRFGLQGQFDHRSPSENTESDRSPLPYTGRSGSGSVMSLGDDNSSITSRSRESYDQGASPDREVGFHMEESGFRRLHIEDYSTRPDSYSPGSNIGQKRRASSPPGDDGPALHTVGSASDLFRRREPVSRTSPAPRFHSNSGSVSSTASGPRSSYTSNLSLAASSITSMNSYGRLSPGDISPSEMYMTDSLYVTLSPLNPSPRGSLSRTGHQRTTPSETRPITSSRKLSDINGLAKHNASPKMQGIFMCECCPKKPKKFESQEDLNAHEQEKQYECAYCRNRFKNKNEAERHQNSLHLRRHSWSCAVLSGYPAAFHNSPNRPNEADTCGYCGDDFPRSGMASPSPSGPPVAVATEQDWDIRIGHLQEMHKFGECNHAKKFFRADHFRQHLKHSHAGTSGKWTNMLENACMKDEPIPEPRAPQKVSPGGSSVEMISEEDEIS